MRRFFTEPENINENTAVILEDASHITKVLRMNSGDEIIIFDGTGYEYIARLTLVDKDRCVAEIISSSFSKQEPEIRVTIYQGIPKSDKMEGIIQKSVELGVHSIVLSRWTDVFQSLMAEKNRQKSLKDGIKSPLKPPNNAAVVFCRKLRSH